jgi:hypothetical protein
MGRLRRLALNPAAGWSMRPHVPSREARRMKVAIVVLLAAARVSALLLVLPAGS